MPKECGEHQPLVPNPQKLRRQFEEDVRLGQNIPEGHRKWSQAAQDKVNAKLDALYWEEYARLGQHLLLPEGLRKDKAFLLHVYGPDENGKPKMAELYPLRLDEHLPRSLSVLFQWSNDRSILGDPLPPPDQPKKETPKGPVEDKNLIQKVTEAHRMDLLNRARALPKALQGGLKANWPKNIPSLNKDGHTEEQLDFIEDLIAGQESLVLIADNFPGSTIEDD